MNRWNYYFAAILLHLLALFILWPLAGRALSSKVKMSNLEVTLLANPAPVPLVPPAEPLVTTRQMVRNSGPRGDSGAGGDFSGSPAAGPLVDDGPRQVSELSFERKDADSSPPDSSPPDMASTAAPSSPLPTLPTTVPNSSLFPMGPPVPDAVPPPVPGQGTGSSSDQISGQGHGGGGTDQGGRGGKAEKPVVVADAQKSPRVSQRNGHYYEAVYVPEGITWDAARVAALVRGGHLVTITSAEENVFVFGLVQDPKFWLVLSVDRISGPWLGGSKAGAAQWVWENGEGLFEYTNWDDGEPDNSNGVQDKLCFYSNPLPDFQPLWDDQSGMIKHAGYIVEWEDGPPEIEP